MQKLLHWPVAFTVASLLRRRRVCRRKIVPLLLVFAFTGFAVEPNKIKTTIHEVGTASGTSVDLVTVTYSDGLGRNVEQKVRINGSKDRVTKTFYDKVGRPDTVIKSFIDIEKPGSYLGYDMKKLNDPVTGPLRLQYNDAKPFSYTKYWPEPLGRVTEQNGPGAGYDANAMKTWYLGVSDEASKTIGFTDGGTSYSVTFEKGFITTFLADVLLDAVVNRLLDQDDFNCSGCPGANHFLTVTKDAKGNYTQELNDLFGKAVGTRAMTTPMEDEIKSVYTYDILGNLTVEEAPKSATASITNTVYTYNRLNQLIDKVTADGGAFCFGYTKTGKLEFDTSYVMDAGAKKVLRLRKYTYDDFDRPLTTEVLENGAFIPVTINYYDSPGSIPEDDVTKYDLPADALSKLENLKGRLAASIAVNRSSTAVHYVGDLYSYDERGRIKRKIKIVPGLPAQYTGFYYDIQDKVLCDTVECGADKIIRNYTYDAEGRRKSIAHTSGLVTTDLVTYTYDDLSRLDYKDLATTAGHRVDYGFNIREWVETIASPAAATNRFSENITTYEPNGNVRLASYGYNYTGAASPVSMDFTYSYDGVNRLKEAATANTAYMSEYNYDVIGRFKRKKEGGSHLPDYQYYAGTNRLRNTDNASSDKKYFFDKHGNMVVDAGKKMVVELDWRDMPVAFRFYNQIPTEIGAKNDGHYDISDTEKDLYKFMSKKISEPSPTTTLLSQVIMLYDASGNRVYKLEGK